MPDPESSPPEWAAKRPKHYPNENAPATPSLQEMLFQRIRDGGPLPFSEFMTTALYEPALGYYAKGTRQVVRGGDFFTSVSVGPLFGRLLARRFLWEWKTIGQSAWRIIECGAHDGSLAWDVLDQLRRLDGDAFAKLEYGICEPIPSLRAAQSAKLKEFGQTVRIVPDAAEFADCPLPGVAFGNELLDALPFHLIEWREGKWWERRVAAGFEWTLVEIPAGPLESAIHGLGGPFPEGYRTEVRTGYGEFLKPLARALESGVMIWFDYGFARPDYYHPARHQGTLRTFSRHRAGECPLSSPGEIDITAHVDFTAVAKEAEKLGARPLVFRNQGSWLTEVAREWLLGLDGEPHPGLMRQFRTLTHPAHLGGQFHVIELTWDLARRCPDPQALAHRLAF